MDREREIEEELEELDIEAGELARALLALPPEFDGEDGSE